MSLQELQEAAYFDMLKCLVYTGAYNFKAQILLTKIRKTLDIPTTVHHEWLKRLEASAKSGTYDFERIPGVAGAFDGGPAAVQDPAVQRQSSVAGSSSGGFAGQQQHKPQPPPVGHHRPGPVGRANASGGGSQQQQSAVQQQQQQQQQNTGQRGAGDVDITPVAKKPRRVGPNDDPYACLGWQVNRLWNGVWHTAVVTDYKPETGKHCLSYDLGTKSETFEDLKLWEPNAGLEWTNTYVNLAQYPTSLAVKNSNALASLMGGGKARNGKASTAKRTISGLDSDEDD